MKVYDTLKARIASYKIARYLKARKQLCYPPYDKNIYDRLLESIINNKKIKTVAFLNAPTKEQVNIYIRHDIDTDCCIKKMSILLDLNEKRKVSAGVYLLANEKEYFLSEYREIILRYKEKGFEFGLHTACYAKDDYMREFEEETERFASALGFRPKSFTVHGLGDFRMDVRVKFYKEIANRFKEFGYEFGDIPSHRQYDYVIQDCHRDKLKNIYMCDDFIKGQRFLGCGSKCLVLTHPCYWNDVSGCDNNMDIVEGM